MKISILGRGMNPSEHLTVAGIRALREADKVIGIEPEKDAWRTMQDEFDLPEIEDVSALYHNGASDQENYNRFIDYVTDLSARNQNLVLLVAGHPRLGVTFVEPLKRRLSGKFEIEVLEGISSFDVMMNQMSLDPLERGASILDVNRVLLFDYKLEPYLDYFLYHICSVGNSRTEFENSAKGNHLRLLKEHLLRTFNPEKTVYLCKGSSGLCSPERVQAVSLEVLDEMEGEIDFSTSLYVPAEKPVRINKEYLQLLRN